jgi:hypothetical protein
VVERVVDRGVERVVDRRRVGMATTVSTVGDRTGSPTCG